MHIGIIGLGLIGGSLAKSFKKKLKECMITAYDLEPNILKLAFAQGYVDFPACLNHSSTPDKSPSFYAESFSSCDVVFICTPVHVIIPVIQELRNHLNPQCILTDVGSTKGEIMGQIKALSLANPFIGGHPMAGSEKKGYEYASDLLLENAYYLLVPAGNSTDEHVAVLTDLLKSIGALVLIMDSDSHDYVTAAVSHVPHVIASGLVNAVKASDNQKKHMHTLAAGGFRDITRIASSSPSLWQAICFSNKHYIIRFLDTFLTGLHDFKEALLRNDKDVITTFFEQSKQYRDSFEQRTTGALEPVYELRVAIEDRPGIIARIATDLADERINIKNMGIIHNREGFEGVFRIEFYDSAGMEKAHVLLKKAGYAVYMLA